MIFLGLEGGAWILASIVSVYSRVSSSVGISSWCSFRLSRYSSMASFAAFIASSMVHRK